MIVEALSWDSDFFNMKIGKSSANSILDFKSIKNDTSIKFDLIYLFSEKKQADLICIDEKVDFEIEVDSKINTATFGIDIWKGPIVQELVDLALLSGHSSRFKLDRQLSHKYKELYILWLQKSIDGELADYVLVAREKNEIIGLLTLKIHETCSRIGLVAVQSKQQGAGWGRALLDKACELTKAEGKTILRVATQARNEDAMNYYRSYGLKTHKTEYIYHLWRDENFSN
jgi:dTDP-4-amino-4,6-dideoxy-D-galactose acyltransferase